MDHWRDLNLYTVYSDDHTPKPVCLEAKGLERKPRHVTLLWHNRTSDAQLVVQVIQLNGIPGKYSYPATPTAVLRSSHSLAENTLIPLGTFSRPQRDRILQLLAEAVAFEPTSTVNKCHAWLRDLLEARVSWISACQARPDVMAPPAPPSKATKCCWSDCATKQVVVTRVYYTHSPVMPFYKFVELSVRRP